MEALNCYDCNLKMSCYGDIKRNDILIAFFKCDKCNSKGKKHYDTNKKEDIKIEWNREV